MTEKIEKLFVKLIEECSEVSKDCCKALTFGLNDKEPGQELTNKEKIFNEFNDLVAVMDMLKEEQVFKHLFDHELIKKKKIKVNKYLNYDKKN